MPSDSASITLSRFSSPTMALAADCHLSSTPTVQVGLLAQLVLMLLLLAASFANLVTASAATAADSADAVLLETLPAALAADDACAGTDDDCASQLLQLTGKSTEHSTREEAKVQQAKLRPAKRNGCASDIPPIAPAGTCNWMVIMRHGRSLWNAYKKATGWMDVPLVGPGKVQPQLSSKMLKQAGFSFSHYHSSILERAAKTLDEALKEFGECSDCKPADDLPCQGGGNLTCERSWKLNERHYGGWVGLDKTTGPSCFMKLYEKGGSQFHKMAAKYEFNSDNPMERLSTAPAPVKGQDGETSCSGGSKATLGSLGPVGDDFREMEDESECMKISCKVMEEGNPDGLPSEGQEDWLNGTFCDSIKGKDFLEASCLSNQRVNELLVKAGQKYSPGVDVISDVKSFVREHPRADKLDFPNGESGLELWTRVKSYMEEHVMPQLKEGKPGILAAHNHVIRVLVKYFDSLKFSADPRDEDIGSGFEKVVKFGNAWPLVYFFDDNMKPIVHKDVKASCIPTNSTTGDHKCMLPLYHEFDLGDSKADLFKRGEEFGKNGNEDYAGFTLKAANYCMNYGTEYTPPKGAGYSCKGS